MCSKNDNKCPYSSRGPPVTAHNGTLHIIAKNKPDQKIIVEQLKQRIKKLQQENSKLREQIEVIYGKMLEKEAKSR